MNPHKWFGRDPALVIQTVTAALALLVGFRLPGLNDELAALVTAVLVALAAAWQLLFIRPWAPTIFSGVITAAAALVSSFGLDLTQQQVSTITGLVAMVIALLVRNQSTPAYDPRETAEV